ncbi:MAG: DUF4860 domain-containing protein [Pseudobutyrivibrio sp.]|nr:DUF4860 domain-containing protein [Pseudobutyrivibrio sp.]
MKKGRIQKHNIDIMFLMVLFLIFTFSAVSVLLMAVNSYKSVVSANETNSNARTAIAYIRETVRQHDDDGEVTIDEFDGTKAIKMSEGEGYSLYIYQHDGYLMELEAKDDAGITAEFGNKILQVDSLDFSWKNQSKTLLVQIEDAAGKKQEVSIGIKSNKNSVPDPVAVVTQEVESDEE